jgi:prevent-host-death family protein
MIINATEFKNRVGKYLEIANKEDIIILKNGKQVAKLISMDRSLTPNVEGLMGLIRKAPKVNKDIDLEQIREERLKKYESAT